METTERSETLQVRALVDMELKERRLESSWNEDWQPWSLGKALGCVEAGKGTGRLDNTCSLGDKEKKRNI